MTGVSEFTRPAKCQLPGSCCGREARLGVFDVRISAAGHRLAHGLAAVTIVLGVAVASSARAETKPPEDPHPVVVAQASSCADRCRQQHNQCRIATKGARSCDAQLQRCLQGCLHSKRR